MRHLLLLGLAAAAAACSGQSGNNAAASGQTATPAPNTMTAAPATPRPNMAASYTARGGDPEWTLSIGGGQMIYHNGRGGTASTATPEQRQTANGFEFLTGGLIVRFTNTPCTEAGGRSAPYTVEVVNGMVAPVTGCGR